MGENMWVEFSADITRVFFTTTEAQLLFLDDAIFRPTPMPLPVMEGSNHPQELQHTTPLTHREGTGEGLPGVQSVLSEQFMLHTGNKMRRAEKCVSLNFCTFAAVNLETINQKMNKMKKTMLIVLALLGLMAQGMSAQPRSRIVEEGGTGAYKAVMKEVATLPAHTVFVPQDLTAFSQKHPLPVLVWGNGACSNSPWEHYKFLNEIASHGYLVLATGYIPMDDEPYKGPMSTTQQQIESIDWAVAQNADPQSPYFEKIDTKHICVAGMSCGGLQSLFNCADPRITALMICNSGLFKVENAAQAVGGMPMPQKSKLKDIHTPVFYILGGKEDIAYENGMDDYRLIQHVSAYVANYPVGHGGTYREAHGGEFTIPALAWLDWQLKGDGEAAKMLTGKHPGLLQRKGWTLEYNKK